MENKLFDVLIILCFVGAVGLVWYLAIRFQKLRAQNEIDTIKVKDDEIEKEIVKMPLNKLVDDNNKEPGGSGEKPS